MAKAKKAPSAHSRAARRATSPGIDTDKSLKNVQPPPESINIRPAVLAAHHGGGVTKSVKKRKSQLSHKARLRAERNAEKGEAVAERTSLKVQKSKGKARVIQSRKKTWDELNREILGHEAAAAAAAKKKGSSKDEEGDAAVAAFYGDDDDDDEEMDGVEGEEEEEAGDVSTASIPVPAPVGEEEEEIL